MTEGTREMLREIRRLRLELRHDGKRPIGVVLPLEQQPDLLTDSAVTAAPTGETVYGLPILWRHNGPAGVVCAEDLVTVDDFAKIRSEANR